MGGGLEGLASSATPPPGTPLRLPTDFLKVPGQPFVRAVAPCSIPETLLARVRSSSWDAEALWLAAFAALGHRYTQQRAFDVGTNLRSRDGVRGEEGSLSILVDGEQTGEQLLEQLSAALAAGEGPRPPEVPAGSLPVRLTFFETEADHERDEAGELTWQSEIQLVFVDRTPRAIIYDARLFLPGTIARLLEHLEVLSTALLETPNRPVAHLPLLTPAEREQILRGWRSADRPYPPRPLHRYIEAHAAERPDATAVTFNDQQLTYRQLERRANQLAQHLLAQGVTPGSRVAVCLEPCAEIAVCILGIFKAGATHVPLDPGYPRDRLAVILEDVRPQIVIAQARAAASLPPVDAPIFLLDRDQAILDRLPDVPPEVEIGLGQPAFVVYTSGTTGKPKGVVMSHANLVHFVISARDRYGFGPSEVMPAVARFTFSITMFEVLLPLVAGGRLIVLERDHVLDLRRLVRTLQETTAVHVSPSLWRKVLAYLKAQAIGPEAFRNLRHVSSGGDLVSPDVVEGLKRAFDRAEVFVIYGCSEIACMGCTYFVPRERTATKSLVGKPFDNVSLRLCDPNGDLVPIGISGEIYFGGAGIALGYLNRDDLTRERFVTLEGERFYRTGDIGRYDEDGNVEILGRSDFQIKLRGIRIELGDVEAALRQAPGVRDGVTAARDLGGEEKTLVGYLVPSEGHGTAATFDVRAVRRFLLSKLPDYMVPAAFVVLDALPVNINNKLDRAALPAPTAADLARLRSLDPPRDERERNLVAIWERVLNIRPIGIRDSFFEIGGDSLQSVTLMVEIEKAFGVALPLSTVLTDPTIEGVAALLAAGGGESGNPLVLLRDGKGAPPVFFIHDGEGEVLPYRNLSLRLDPAHPVYGLRPVSRAHHPMMHSRISEVVDRYAAEIRRVQPEGPYLLSGLCIGGFIAFEIARKLKSEGETIGAVVMLDAAHVTAREKSLATRRLKSFSASMGETAGRKGLPDRVVELARGVLSKATNLVKYEVRSRVEKRRNRLKMQLFRLCLDHDLPLPRFVEDIPVRVVLRFAEKEYVIPTPYDEEVALFRATKKDSMFDGTLIDDTPYVDLFVDPLMEWGDKVARIALYDMPGGHSSMLVEPHVQELAVKFQNYLDRALQASPPASARVEKTELKYAPAM